MEFVKGAPLKGPFSLEETVEYATQILDASGVDLGMKAARAQPPCMSPISVIY